MPRKFFSRPFFFCLSMFAGLAVAQSESGLEGLLVGRSLKAPLQDSGNGFPWISLAPGRDMEHTLRGSEGLLGSFSRQRVPHALASADFDEDGVPDLVCGFSIFEGGAITLHFGSKDPLHPFSKRSLARRREGIYSDNPFHPQARLQALPESAEFLGAGDFDSDRHWDIVAGRQGSSRLWLLRGLGDGTFQEAEAIELPGTLTAFLVGEINRRDLREDVIVGVETNEGPRLVIFQSPWGAFNGGQRVKPEILDLPHSPSDLTLGDMDEDCMLDLAVAAGNEVILFQGRDRRLLWPEEVRRSVMPPQQQIHEFDRLVVSIAFGDFRGDLEEELAVLTEEGTIEILARQGQELLGATPLSLRARSMDVANADLVTARVSSLMKDDLLILDSAGRRIEILVEDVPGESRLLRDRFPDGLLGSTVHSSGQPAAILPMRLNRDALSDLVVLTDAENPLSFISTNQSASTIVVNKSGDERGSSSDDICDTDNDPENGKQCTLGEAIVTANFREGLDTIEFAVPVISIERNFGLPQINDPVVIDGTTAGLVKLQPAKNEQGEVINTQASPRLIINASATGSTIKGVEANIRISNSSNNIIEGNRLGVFPGGTFIETAMRIQSDSAKNTVGGTTEEARNILPGAEDAVGAVGLGDIFGGIEAANLRENKILGNYIGTNETGTEISGYGGGVGLRNAASCNQIGGLAAGQGNLISGGLLGVGINRGSTDNVVAGNLIGTDKTGNSTNPDRAMGECPDEDHRCAPRRMSNSSYGILLNPENSDNEIVENVISGTGFDTSLFAPGVSVNGTGNIIRDNKIGTNKEGDVSDPDGVPGNGDEFGNRGPGLTLQGSEHIVTGNVIAASRDEGIRLRGTNFIQGNWIGTSPVGGDLGNGSDGITAFSADDSTIQMNEIAFNGRSGIHLTSGTGNTISENSIHENGLLGIDLFGPGVTPNDPDGSDNDEGPNNLQNFPVLVKVNDDGIHGTLNGSGGKTFRLEFFASPECDPSGNGEGWVFIGFVQCANQTDAQCSTANGDLTFNTPFGAPEGEVITATATELISGLPASTSEFSACVRSQAGRLLLVNSGGDETDEDFKEGRDFDGICDTGKEIDVGGEEQPECTLRAALTEANADGLKDTIQFARGLAIVPARVLPEVTQPVTIDGTGRSIHISGLELEAGSGLVISSGDSTIRGLVIQKFPGDGILLKEKGNNRIRDNELFFNKSNGIRIESNGNVIGGISGSQSECLDPCNLITLNKFAGVQIFSGDDNFVQGNFIGSDGRAKGLGNFIGINIDGGERNRIGGTPGERNLISGNDSSGIRLGQGADNNFVQGNFIGRAIDGSTDLGNGRSGISILAARIWTPPVKGPVHFFEFS